MSRISRPLATPAETDIVSSIRGFFFPSTDFALNLHKRQKAIRMGGRTIYFTAFCSSPAALGSAGQIIVSTEATAPK
jgi:hypothetical protein